jgi:uncharacterized RDD family membrane protein YckC
MPCPLCGDICRCSSDAPSAAPPRWLADGDAHLAAASPQPKADSPRADAATLGPAVEAAASADSNEPACSARRDEDEDSDAWRQEVAARLNRYQARHKPRPPRYPSLRLPFEKDAAPAVDMDSSPIEPPSFPRRMTPASNRALALDEFADIVSDAVEADPIAGPAPSLALPHAQASPEAKTEDKPQPAAPATAKGKIIEFPRFWTPAPPPLDELAEPVFDRDRPRILEAPEVVPPLPALGGITIEPAQRPEVEKRPGIDIPLQTASLARRIFSAAIDGVIIAAAGVLFAFIFWKLAEIRPPRFEIIGLAAGLSGLFWAAYQYLLLVYSGTTPGLLLARLELARFNGSPAGRRLRRWRVLASFLSAASLGMGYAWVFLDEDSLCWHDRITHTYLAPKGQVATKPGNPTD